MHLAPRQRASRLACSPEQPCWLTRCFCNKRMPGLRIFRWRRRICWRFHVLALAGPSRATGGVATLARKSWAGADAVVESETTPDEMHLIDRVLKGDTLLVVAAPTSAFAYVGGDFNFKDEGGGNFGF